jgi:(R,R)-butanediol dehydrogenase / meso-butanediol dehydrogenase / diacetyl reductase
VYSCGQCVACRSGRYNVWATVLVALMAHLLPDNVSLELGALVEPMSVAYHAVELGAPEPTGTALVLGAEPIDICL